MLNELIAIINERAVDASFSLVAVETMMTAKDNLWPNGKAPGQQGCWESGFASLLLVDITDADASEASRLAKLAESYLDARILQREKTGAVIDGYLVLAVSSAPEFKPFIAEVERNTLFMRKHAVIKGDEGWERYERITPLGLGRSAIVSAAPVFAPDDMGAVDLLDALASMSSKELADLHGKEWNLNE
ncbi:hypothetical protein [Pseudomonas sp. GL-B-19]|uniref:hypothetical protein n=1 Tax=Pseudomonas sp. GL-B-19 TaxID=2832393 RepID=UPI001CBF53B1|nr:hypothetical protein [Pseudomonas sp. GL-B-19]